MHAMCISGWAGTFGKYAISILAPNSLGSSPQKCGTRIKMLRHAACVQGVQG